jgi:transposase
MSQVVRRYPLWFRERVMSCIGSPKEITERWKISPKTVIRWRKRLALTGSLKPGRLSPGRPRKLSLLLLVLLGLFKLLFPDV